MRVSNKKIISLSIVSLLLIGGSVFALQSQPKSEYKSNKPAELVTPEKVVEPAQTVVVPEEAQKVAAPKLAAPTPPSCPAETRTRIDGFNSILSSYDKEFEQQKSRIRNSMPSLDETTIENEARTRTVHLYPISIPIRTQLVAIRQSNPECF